MKINSTPQNTNFNATFIKTKSFQKSLESLAKNNSPIANAIEDSLIVINKKDTTGKYKLDILFNNLTFSKLIDSSGTKEGKLVNNNKTSVINLLKTTPKEIKKIFNDFVINHL